MKKIKYQGAITKILATKKADYHKKRFLKDIRNIKKYISANTSLNFDIISFSGANGFEDQVLSIYSCLHYAGIPRNWTIYSDKSYTENHKQFFIKQFPFVIIKDWDVFDVVDKNEHLSGYLKFCHLAKKINIILGHPYQRQTMYVDSDVIFYKHIVYYLNNPLLQSGLWYISDAIGNIETYLATNPATLYPLNSGFLLLNSTFNNKYIFEYFENLKGRYHYFSEQSSLDFAFKSQPSNLLDPRQFVVDTEDQFDFSTKYLPAAIAVRHYVSPIRHKLWQNGWKWNFI